jgi:elongation factor Ts
MAEISAQLVKELREKTGAGMMDCKKALAEAGGDCDKAIEVLRKKGLKDVDKRSGKIASEGVIYSYIHSGGRIGVMLELNSETDFVARGDDFTTLAKDIAMHVAWSNPRFLQREEVPEKVLDTEKDIFLSQLKPEQQKMADKILPGKLEKFYEENCLLEQFDARDPAAKKRIKDLISDLSAKIGEKIVLRRFVRFEVGEGIEKAKTDYVAEVAAAMGAN